MPPPVLPPSAAPPVPAPARLWRAGRRWGWEGVYATPDSRRPRDVRGQSLDLQVVVMDQRWQKKGGPTPKLLPPAPERGPYKLSVTLQVRCSTAGAAGAAGVWRACWARRRCLQCTC